MLPESFDDALALYADAEPGRMFCAFSGDDEHSVFLFRGEIP